jgi:hypothetical protein
MNKVSRTLVAAVSLGLVAAPIPSALAKKGDKIVQGTCSANSSIKLKLSNEDGRIEVEAEVDQNRNGVSWKYALAKNGVTVKRGAAVTRAPSGSFTVRRLMSNSAGIDRIAVRASRPGEVCTVRATF